MYILALAILLGLAVAAVTEIVYEVAPVVEKVKYLNNPEILFPLLAIIAVWATDTSILGAYGLGGEMARCSWFRFGCCRLDQSIRCCS